MSKPKNKPPKKPRVRPTNVPPLCKLCQTRHHPHQAHMFTDTSL